MSTVRNLPSAVASALYRLANTLLALVRCCVWPRRRPAQPRHVCVYRIGNLGDILCALPAMDAVRRAYPSARITLVTSPGNTGMPGARELLADAPWLDELFVYHGEDIRTFCQRFRLIRQLRQKKFDVWMELPSSLATLPVLLRNMLAARLSGARWGYGWTVSTIKWAARAQAEQKVFPNEVERLRLIVARCGIPTPPVRFPLTLTKQHAGAVDRMLRSSTTEGAPIVAIAPGAKRPANRWPLERYVEVGQALSRLGFHLLLVGGAGDEQACNWLASQIGSNALSLAGHTSALESCEALRRCAFVVCNDSGVQHMAAAVGTPCVSIFSAREMRGKWHPHGAQNIVLREDVPCRACYLDECPRDNLCVKLVQVADVMGAAEHLRWKMARPA
ncbi:MAG TPA: glycosyltransferase family 9 protein [Terriglobia bacterium]|nr:glycosyltransferase family 9 protein [Terriglobia bacterium]